MGLWRRLAGRKLITGEKADEHYKSRKSNICTSFRPGLCLQLPTLFILSGVLDRFMDCVVGDGSPDGR